MEAIEVSIITMAAMGALAPAHQGVKAREARVLRADHHLQGVEAKEARVPRADRAAVLHIQEVVIITTEVAVMNDLEAAIITTDVVVTEADTEDRAVTEAATEDRAVTEAATSLEVEATEEATSLEVDITTAATGDTEVDITMVAMGVAAAHHTARASPRARAKVQRADQAVQEVIQAPAAQVQVALVKAGGGKEHGIKMWSCC
jgi:hypothetical protein